MDLEVDLTDIQIQSNATSDGRGRGSDGVEALTTQGRENDTI